MRIEHKTGRVEVYDVGPLALRELTTALTVPNPKYLGAIRAGKKPMGIPQVIKFYSGDGEHLTIPAGCVGMAVAAADRHGEPLECIVGLQTCAEVDFTFNGSLRLYQMAALAQVTRSDFGVLEAPTGSGKTVMGCAAIAQRRQPTLIVVHNRMLQAQWVEAVRDFLGVDAGRIGGGRAPGCDPYFESHPVIVAIINSLAKCAAEVAPHIGHLVVDECHRAPAASYWRTLQAFGCRYRLGLSATPYRRDGLDDAIQWALGPITKVERELLVRSGHVLPTETEQIGTDFVCDVDPREHYQAVISEVIVDNRRNMQITEAVRAAEPEGVVLVLSDRVEHLEVLWPRLAAGAVLLHGGLGAAARREAVAALPTASVICATTQMVGEGFNLPAATTAVLATPIKWSGRLLQAIGRVLRPAPGKTCGKILDFADWNVPVLASGARSRAKVYRQLRLDENGGNEDG